jgi:hypothetical protein
MYRFVRRLNRKTATIACRVVKWPRLKGSGLGGPSDETHVRSCKLPARPLPHGHLVMRILPAFAGADPADYRSIAVDLLVRDEPDEEEEEEDDDESEDDGSSDGYSE